MPKQRKLTTSELEEFVGEDEKVARAIRIWVRDRTETHHKAAADALLIRNLEVTLEHYDTTEFEAEDEDGPWEAA